MDRAAPGDLGIACDPVLEFIVPACGEADGWRHYPAASALGEEYSMELARRFAKIRSALLGEKDDAPKIDVTNVEKDRFG